MNYTNRHNELINVFSIGKDVVLEDSGVEIRFFPFKSKTSSMSNVNNVMLSDEARENESFLYPVFQPQKRVKKKNAILLMHGLNERNWSKYLTWAEYLCLKTHKPVILFPIAFHINRSPLSWSNPRTLQPLIEMRKKIYGRDRSLSFANVALSERISQNPIRFFSSGKQSLEDITLLMRDIRSGCHPLFEENTHVDVFAYSIGAFLSQIAFMTNPDNLFEDSKLFMFCGGSIFSSMFGESKSIMDKPAFEKLLNYYKNEFDVMAFDDHVATRSIVSFDSMIAPDRHKNERLGFFRKLGKRISGISLKSDTVIPYEGVEKAIGSNFAHKRIKLFDFEFPYSHENPFPLFTDKKHIEVDRSFHRVFRKASAFLA